MLTGYSKYTAERISEGYCRGGYSKLKEAYPKKVAAMEKDLEDNWSKEALDTYRERLVRGLMAIDMWDIN